MLYIESRKALPAFQRTPRRSTRRICLCRPKPSERVNDLRAGFANISQLTSMPRSFSINSACFPSSSKTDVSFVENPCAMQHRQMLKQKEAIENNFLRSLELVGPMQKLQLRSRRTLRSAHLTLPLFTFCFHCRSDETKLKSLGSR